MAMLSMRFGNALPVKAAAGLSAARAQGVGRSLVDFPAIATALPKRSDPLEHVQSTKSLPADIYESWHAILPERFGCKWRGER
jgi:hypothetical protein